MPRKTVNIAYPGRLEVLCLVLESFQGRHREEEGIFPKKKKCFGWMGPLLCTRVTLEFSYAHRASCDSAPFGHTSFSIAS